MKAINFVKSNSRQILETLGLAVAIFLPFCLNFQEIFKEYLSNNPPSPDNYVAHLVLTCGKPLASIILFLLVLWPIRKFNDGFVMNHRFLYHDYCYAWYWFCAKVLGIKKCNLILVPIHMQFKLVIRGTFAEYPLNDDAYPIVANEPDCKVTKTNLDAGFSEINVILEDTYVIEDRLIPKSKRSVYTLRISRNDGKDNGRHFSPKFIEATINELRCIKRIQNVNVFATTNPKNTVHLAKRVFALAERGIIDHLYVFQQKKDGRRYFEQKGHRIY